MSRIVVHHLPSAWDLPSISPFCLKIDCYLRMASIQHESVIDAAPFGAPKGKLPYIEHNGNRIGDSSQIIEYLTRELDLDFDRHLTSRERAIARSIQRLIEENLYWVLVYARWVEEGNWRIFRPIVLGGISPLLRPVIALLARRGVRKQLSGHGMGAHSRDEIYAIGAGDLKAISEFLGDRDFLMGENPSSIDATAYGFLANIAYVPLESPLKAALISHPNLMAYIERLRTRYYPVLAN